MATHTLEESPWAAERPVSPMSPDTMDFPMQGARGDNEGETGETSRSAAVAAATPAAPATQEVTANDTASSIDHVDDKVPPKPTVTKREKLKRHCGRFKWWYLVGLIIFLAIILPILFKVIIPVIVQNIVNGQKLPINGGAIRAISPTELQISLDTSLDTPLPATIDALPLALYNSDSEGYKPFATLDFPTSNVNKKTSVSVENQTVEIENEDELVKWFSNVFDKPSVELSVYGKPTARLGALTYHPDLDLTIDVPALNYLEGFSIEDISFIMPPEESGINMRGALNLPNAGVLTLGLGNLTFNMLAGEVKLGVINIYDVELKPGNNSQPFDGTLYFDQLIPNLIPIVQSQSSALTSGNLELAATGNASTVNGEHIKYLETVLSTKRLVARLPIFSVLADVLTGMVGNDDASSSIGNVIGNVFGNSTLLEGGLDRWTGGGDDAEDEDEDANADGNEEGGEEEGSGNARRSIDTKKPILSSRNLKKKASAALMGSLMKNVHRLKAR